eukprot:jgi/Ulvmu1/38/UM001_0040.1
MELLYAAGIAALLHGAVVTGQQLECHGACVATWKKCAGEGIPAGTIRPCCDPEDHCVEKTSKYSQCRPVSRDIPSSWPSGKVLNCTDPPECDPTAIVSRLQTLSAFRLADNDDIEIAFFDGYDLDVRGTTCPEECQASADCFVFGETSDGECTLYGKNLFSLEGTLIPHFDAELFLTKCFLPEPLCDPATREVRRVNSVRRADGGPHWMAADEDVQGFSIDTPAAYVTTAAINACRLQQFSERLGGCIGFVVEDIGFGPYITLLYDFIDADTHVAFRGSDLAKSLRVYDIQACL